jgi:ABC-type sugar transport system substrate-binding protein
VHVRIRAKFSGRATLAIVLAATLALSACSKKNDTPSAAAPTSGQSAASSGAAGAKVKVAFVPKLQGIPYFEAMNAGGEEAAAALPIDWLYQGSTSADAAAQADIVSSYIQQKVDALFIAPNDADSMAPLIKQAADAGIKVGTSDTDAPNSAREVMVLMASSEGIGEANTDALMKAMGGKGKFAIVSCGETATQLNEWIAAIKSYTAAKYPDAEIVDTVYAGEDVAKATQIGTDLMNAHPDMLHCRSRHRTGRAERRKDRHGFHRWHGNPQRHEAVFGERRSVGRCAVGCKGFGIPHSLGGFAVGAGQRVPGHPKGRGWGTGKCDIRSLDQDLVDGQAADLRQDHSRQLQLLIIREAGALPASDGPGRRFCSLATPAPGPTGS